ncbi:MAG: HAD family hydrolase [Candidatus Nezhaarchaeales archaeon]
MPVKVVIINLDSALLKVDVSEVESKLRGILGVEGDLKNLIAEALLRSSDQSKAKAIDEVLKELEDKTAEEAEIDQEDLEAVCTLKAIGVKLALVTMRGRESTEKALEKIGLKGIFDVVVTRDDEPEKALQIAKACSSLGYRVDEALYVGFSRADAIAGAQAGCLVATPHRVLQALSQMIRVNSLHELLDIFRFTS